MDNSIMPAPNREYKSSVFASYFNEPARLIELYNALSGSNYPPDTPIQINTLDMALYYDRVNDLSFELDGRLIVLFEHQSTWNPNMPFRMLLYIAKLYEKRYAEATPFYSTILQKIDAVDCYVLYNGIEKHPERAEWKLSDMFTDANTTARLELTVPVYNINDGYNAGILEKSRSLAEYAHFINLVNSHRGEGIPLKEAIDRAVRECIDDDVMLDYLTVHGSEARNLLFADFDYEAVMAVRVRDEVLKAHIKAQMDYARDMSKAGLDDNFIASILKLSPEKVAEYRLKRRHPTD